MDEVPGGLEKMDRVNLYDIWKTEWAYMMKLK